MVRRLLTAAWSLAVLHGIGCNGVLGGLRDRSADGGTGDVAEGGGNDSTTGSDSEASSESCSAPTSGGLALSSEGYQSAMAAGGYCFPYSDSSPGCSPCGTSTACMAASTLCASGQSSADLGNNWGGGVGCNLNQPKQADDAGAEPPIQSIELTGVGVNYSLVDMPGGAGAADAVYLTINDGVSPANPNGTEYYCQIKTVNGTCLWGMFNSAPWVTNGVSLTGPPTAATSIHVQVSSSARAESWQVCISNLAVVSAGGIGDPCLDPTDCASDNCVGLETGAIGWCTTACTKNSDCNGSYTAADLNAQGTVNRCEQTCTPSCAQASDCAAFTGAGCLNSLCTFLGGIGDECLANTDCQSANCNAPVAGAPGWCTAACTSASDCNGSYPGARNAQGSLNACVQTSNGFGLLCFPECTQSPQCASFLVGCAPVEGGLSVCG